MQANLFDLKTIDLKKINDKASAKWVLECEEAEVVNLLVEPLGEIPPHTMKMKVLFYVIAGQGVFILENEEKEVQEATVLEVPANLKRGWKNNGKQTLSLLVVKIH